jgi:hypothetical protein
LRPTAKAGDCHARTLSSISPPSANVPSVVLIGIVISAPAIVCAMAQARAVAIEPKLDRQSIQSTNDVPRECLNSKLR